MSPASLLPPSLLGPLRRHALRLAAQRLVPRPVLVRHGASDRPGDRPGDRRRAALSFDDGPHELTSAYLDVLERRGVRATFFVVGEECRDHGRELVDMVARGHEVAHHGYRHLRLPLLTRPEIERELRLTAALLPPPRGRRPLLRPPNGDTSVRSLLVSALAGYRTVLWSRDSDDCRSEDPDVVAERLSPSRVVPGDILLLHEGQPWTLAALPRIIDGLLGAGFELVTVGELLDGGAS